jgi:hypothetical protein
MDFYERVSTTTSLLRRISQRNDDLLRALRPGAFKTFSKPDRSFWCRAGTGMENLPSSDTSTSETPSRSSSIFHTLELRWKRR